MNTRVMVVAFQQVGAVSGNREAADQTATVSQPAGSSGDDVERAYEIAGGGLTIVFVALVLIACFIAVLPRILDAIAQFLPPEVEPAPPKAESAPPDDEAIMAGIGYVLHTEMQRRS